MSKHMTAKDVVQRMLSDEVFRRALTAKSFFWFSHFYFPNSFKLPTANFQKEIIHLLESDYKGQIYIAAFRQAGKSTIAGEHYPLFEILARQQKKFVIIASNTERQSQDHLSNIKRGLEDPDNILLERDWGPFREEKDQWGQRSLVFPNLHARISAASVGQSIRGMRHREHRPDLIILDDIENSHSVDKLESRDKIDRWLNEDVIPAGDEHTRIVFLGTPLHDDSVMQRRKHMIAEKMLNGVFKSYPILDDNDQIAWPGRYPSMKEIENQQRQCTIRAWQQEYLLKIVLNEDRVINPDWIQYYHELPDRVSAYGYKFRLISVDPAFSQKQTADDTAIVVADIFGSGKDLKIFIHPNPVNRRGMSAKEIVEYVKVRYDEADKQALSVRVVVESVGAQTVLVQMMRQAGIINVKGVTPGTKDKRERLELAGFHMQDKRVYLPEMGADELQTQILNFGSCRHDDLADAFSQLVLNAAEMCQGGFVIPGPYYPESSYLPRYITSPGENERIRKEAELAADKELIDKSDHERQAGT